jgi:hypothetical protein
MDKKKEYYKLYYAKNKGKKLKEYYREYYKEYNIKNKQQKFFCFFWVFCGIINI